MSSQPDNAPTTISLPAAVLLGVAVTAAATLAAIIAGQSIVHLRVYEGTTALLASLVALTGTGVIICVVADRLMRRLDQMGEQVATFGEQRYQAGHDDGFVDGAAGPSPQVQTLNGRRPRPVTHG